ncbi:MAG: aldehyde dehydrogenase family protein [Phycisphaeraceae bacterium]|nr:MAG: aldehyde dehydrogenase family protein [Phycisphaeraceae bacterium]
MKHPSLTREPSNLIGGRWIPAPGDSVRSFNPARPDQVVFSSSSSIAHLHEAVAAARAALPAWSSWSRERRFAVLQRFKSLVTARAQQIADLICDETGKAMWDSKGEVSALTNKVDITLDATPTGALARVTGVEFAMTLTKQGKSWFRPHGVMAVLGPFNFPAHLPNGHIVPALALGNTIVLKPSDKAPATGQLLIELFQEALDAENAPPGVVNLVQGGADVASALSSHNDIDGILFTGSWPVGRRIMEANLDRPGRILALEMGGNNAAVIMPDADLKQALVECVRSGFVTTGQRCTCTRRVIVHELIAQKFIPAFCKAASNLIIGDPRASHPVFMGPIINGQSRDAVFAFQRSLQKAGAEILVPSTPMDTPERGFYLTPGIARVDRFTLAGESDLHAGRDAGCDTEVFGPFVRICVVKSLDEAIEQANTTRYGLAASIFTKDQSAAERFLFEARAGCINVNTGTAGASSKLPFGGLGLSGNHRPAGAFSVDYCAYPVAGMIETGPDAPLPSGMTIDDKWLA